MTNCEKFRTENERIRAFNNVCGPCEKVLCDRVNALECFNAWLSDEADEEKPLPCPFCGGRCVAVDGSKIKPDRHGVRPYSYVKCGFCGYESIVTNDYGKSGIENVIAAHNRVARAVMEAGKKEEK